MGRTLLGHAVLRSEDPALLTGAARFAADVPVAGALHAVFVRSPVAHGVLRAVDTAAARAAPGVHAVWAATDVDLPAQHAVAGDGALDRPLLATGKVRFAGEPVAVVLADSFAHALDAADLVAVDVDPLPAVVDPFAAAAGGAPLLFPQYGTNVVGNPPSARDDEFFADADTVVRVRVAHQRVAPVTMETSACVAIPEPDGTLSIWASTQSVFRVRDDVARTLGVDPATVRVRAPWVGGGFGAKGGVYPEQLVVAALAHRTGRPVRWSETRRENLLAMIHGRGQVHDVELGARADGTFTGLRVRGLADVGAYAIRGGFIPQITRMMSSGVYAIPKVDFDVPLVLTNASPTGFYRGAGRPEAAALVERAVDTMARELRSDPAELRRRNFPRPEDFPFTTATGATYDSGDYEAALDRALELVRYDELRAEQVGRRLDGGAPLLGIGIACYVETSGRGGEFGSVAVGDDGRVTVVTGSVPQGQGHATVWAQVASDTLGVPFESVEVVHSDTALVDHGVGTFGSRSGQLAGSAVREAASVVLERARTLAAELLESSVDDIVVLVGPTSSDAGGRDGGSGLGVTGVPASTIGWAELAAEGRRRGTPLEHALDFDSVGSFPSGCHVAVVDVDRDTGAVALRDLVAVDDCGVVLNPVIAEGQVHGGLAQGVAQVLLEGVVYDDAGNPRTASLLDYLVPAASELPAFRTDHTVTPSPNNPLGAKGIGESGTTGSIAAVWNAVVDALAPFGVVELDPPCTPELIWRAMRRDR